MWIVLLVACCLLLTFYFLLLAIAACCLLLAACCLLLVVAICCLLLSCFACCLLLAACCSAAQQAATFLTDASWRAGVRWHKRVDEVAGRGAAGQHVRINAGAAGAQGKAAVLSRVAAAARGKAAGLSRVAAGAQGTQGTLAVFIIPVTLEAFLSERFCCSVLPPLIGTCRCFCAAAPHHGATPGRCRTRRARTSLGGSSRAVITAFKDCHFADVPSASLLK